MNRTTILPLLTAWSLCPFSARAQVAVDTPEVQSDRRVTFRLHAPNAKTVTVNLMGRQAEPMTKGEMGVWSGTVGPLAPELYSYTYSVDGAMIIDPQNFKVKKWTIMNSLVEVSGDTPRLHELRRVPHGTVHQHWYFSTAVNTNRSVLIYTPPGYDPRAEKRYPVLFLLHGFGEDESAWTEVGRAHLIADNLLAQGRIQPLVIAMPNGHPLSPKGVPWKDYDPRNQALLDKEIGQDLLPLLSQDYRVLGRPQDRAIAGLSLGGGQALGIGLQRRDTFNWVGAFSAAELKDGDLSTEFLDQTFALLVAETAAKKGTLQLLWLGCGRDDFQLPLNNQLVAWLEARKIPHTFWQTEGRHDWDVWRRDLAEFLPLLFQ
jgi:enterochelin esterase-like enzyme